MATSHKHRYSRAPTGVVTARPVLMRLLPGEREALIKHARAANQSLSAFARSMTLLGLQRACASESHIVQDVPHND